MNPATLRVKKSIQALVQAGGKRLMLRLSPQSYAALKTIMALGKIGTETQAINDTLIERQRQLLSDKENKA